MFGDSENTSSDLSFVGQNIKLFVQNFKKVGERFVLFWWAAPNILYPVHFILTLYDESKFLGFICQGAQNFKLEI